MIVVGLTGGIASGKSTVSRIFNKAGAIIIDADVIAHQVTHKGTRAWRKIQSVFGDHVIGADGEIDRAALGKLVFDDRGLRKQLESIVHPEVRNRIDRELKQLRHTCSHAVVVQDIPLLFETGMTKGLSEIIVVYVPTSLQLKRLMLRDGIAKAEALARIDAQMPIEDKRRLASIVIDNSGDYRATERHTLNVYKQLIDKAREMD